MQTFHPTPDQKLVWTQPKTMQRRFELRCEENLCAVLDFKSAFGSLAGAATDQESWTFKRVGFFNPRVTIRKPGLETDLAIFRPNWTGTQGILEFTGGRSYAWKVSNFWATRYAFLDSLGQTLVNFQSGVEDANIKDIFKVQARVEIDPAGRDLPELAVLVLFGWYLIILSQEDSAAAAAATSGAIG